VEDEGVGQTAHSALGGTANVNTIDAIDEVAGAVANTRAAAATTVRLVSTYSSKW
jgi:hypothetical protein